MALTRSDDGQGVLFRADVEPDTGVWELAALATSLNLEVHSLAQPRRDRTDLENALGEVKNQWGRGGSAICDLTCRQHVARPIALARIGGACSCGRRTPIINEKRSPAALFWCTA